jgi:hypothetical protein
MHAHSLEESFHAAELVGLAVYCRAVAARAVSAEPEVVSLRLEVTFESPGLSVIEVELIAKGGFAIGGFSL